MIPRRKITEILKYWNLYKLSWKWSIREEVIDKWYKMIFKWDNSTYFCGVIIKTHFESWKQNYLIAHLSVTVPWCIYKRIATTDQEFTILQQLQFVKISVFQYFSLFCARYYYVDKIKLSCFENYKPGYKLKIWRITIYNK